MHRKIGKKAGNCLISVITILAALLFLAPLYIVVVNAFKTQVETARSILALPAALNWSNFSTAVEKTNFFVTLRNSTIITLISVVLITLTSAMGGYVICRNYQRRFYHFLDKFLMAGMMISFQMIMIPVYKMLKSWSLLNTFAGAILIMVGTSVSYATFLNVGFVKTIPKELEEAALIDGCSKWGTFWRIVFPLMKPITTTVAALHMLWMWNEFSVSLIVLQKKEIRTIAMQQYYFFGQHISNYNAAFAAACLSLIPVIAFFFLAQKNLAGGMTDGAVKG